uniref:Uncharacterized protein n=1 Tax=Candidatus Methanogaster sp. ANME-2c ERB4 TaxID=2759911 RepID=A0A7G9YAD3_9EURY|nr:hypothetical protein ABJGDBBG_00005 [Methanosarcinales archaeon ANME-2c ERB4]
MMSMLLLEVPIAINMPISPTLSITTMIRMFAMPKPDMAKIMM